MSSHISTDASWPYYHTIVHTLPDDAGLDLLLADMQALLDREEDFVWLMEALHREYPPAHHRARYVDFLRQRQAKIALHCKGFAIALPSMMARLMVRSIFLVATPSIPYAVCKNGDAATSWCVARLRAEGMGVPASLTRSDPNIASVASKVEAIRSAAK